MRPLLSHHRTYLSYPAVSDSIQRGMVIGNDDPPSCELAPHCHGRDQFLYAAQGVLAVSTAGTRNLDSGRQCRVLAVSDLLRSLLVTADSLEPDYDPEGRDGLAMTLLLCELRRAAVIPLSVPFPSTAALAERCHAFLERPDPHAAIDQWSADRGLGRQTFTRLFPARKPA